MRKSSSRRLIAALAALAPIALLVSAPPAGATQTVNVVGYSILSPAFTALEKAFEATPQGQATSFTNSFGASTTQAEDVAAGQPADIVVFSEIPDMQLVVNAGLVPTNWASNATGVAENNFVSDSVIAFVVRSGNPEGIVGWDSLARKGVQIVTPDPISSGSARWNLLGAYFSQLQLKKSAAIATKFLNSVVANVVAEPASASKALSTFESGTGNVLISYEADALNAVATNKSLEIVEPQQNILIQNPSALTDAGLQSSASTAFYQFMYSPQGQQILIANYLRATLPALESTNQTTFYTPQKLWTVNQIGGWTAIDNKFFSTNGIVTKIEAAHGYTS